MLRNGWVTSESRQMNASIIEKDWTLKEKCMNTINAEYMMIEIIKELVLAWVRRVEAKEHRNCSHKPQKILEHSMP